MRAEETAREQNGILCSTGCVESGENSPLGQTVSSNTATLSHHQALHLVVIHTRSRSESGFMVMHSKGEMRHNEART